MNWRGSVYWNCAQHGDEDTAAKACSDLSTLQLDDLLEQNETQLCLNNANLHTLIQRERCVSDQITHFSWDCHSTTSSTKCCSNEETSGDKRRRVTYKPKGLSHSATCWILTNSVTTASELRSQRHRFIRWRCSYSFYLSYLTNPLTEPLCRFQHWFPHANQPSSPFITQRSHLHR